MTAEETGRPGRSAPSIHANKTILDAPADTPKTPARMRAIAGDCGFAHVSELIAEELARLLTTNSAR